MRLNPSALNRRAFVASEGFFIGCGDPPGVGRRKIFPYCKSHSLAIN